MARLATSHIARKKHEKKSALSRRRRQKNRGADKDARRRVHQPHRRVSAHGATRRGHAARVRVRGRARGVRARARFPGEKQAGHAPIAETSDTRTGASVVDAYQTRGDPAALARVIARADVDRVVFDVQDVGARFYTYLSSLYDLLVAVARLNHGSQRMRKRSGARRETTRREEEREKNTNANGKATGAFGSSFWIAPTRWAVWSRRPDGDRAGFRVASSLASPCRYATA